ncbi:unnamed protein product [Sphagnum jensenii]|uniref:Secreted protein n=2 Tax=Sphagnum jensenii TaxID=128206 RepID=A0ABP1A3S7_9BRYO
MRRICFAEQLLWLLFILLHQNKSRFVFLARKMMKSRNPDSKQKKKHIAADSGLMPGEEKRTERRTPMLQLRCLHVERED